MLQLDNFVAWISIDGGHPLQEYHVEYSEDLLMATCWIASEDDKPFAINWRDFVRSQASMGRTFVDGVKCGVPKGINRKGYKKDPSKENDSVCQKGAPTLSGKERQLVFSKVDHMEMYCGPSDKIGEIRLEISSIQKRGPMTLKINSFQEEGKVDEMAKRMAPHSTRVGHFVEGDRKPIHLVKTMGKTKVFIFRYRPMEILKSLGIAQVQLGHLETTSSSGSKHCLDLDMDTGIKQESQDQGSKITKWKVDEADRKEVKTESESQKIKKEEYMDIKIEETQIKVEVDSVKTENKDWFSKLACKTEDVKDAVVFQAEGSAEIIDLSMDD